MGSPQLVVEPPTLSLEELAKEAGVAIGHARWLVELGALDARPGSAPYGAADVRRVRLLRSWEGAGLSVEAAAALVRNGQLPSSWLDVPVQVDRLDLTYAQLCEREDIPVGIMQALQEALGFAPPEPDDRAREGDRELIAPVRALLAAGASEARILRLVRVYADSLRRVAKAEAELYESEIEGRLRRSGRTEREVLDYAARFGDRLIGPLERALVGIYRRQREHVWVEHCVTHAEVTLERAGLHREVSRPPAICFVDLTGYTRITEERGDEVAARMAADLASLIEDLSRRHGGRPVRWLGDGGMFHFRHPGEAVLSGLDMVESASRAGLPPMHIGIHTGPVVFQDGDVYGRTVNLASRIASHAGAGEVLASEETVRRSPDGAVRFEPLGPVRLKGISKPVTLHRARRPAGR